ncbi:MAG: response regulator, partial [Methylocystis sp.]|nr:response regulator [Methylocystis sp.]
DGSSGLDAVNEILVSLSIPVIFVTAYPERFLTGEPPEPAFLIAKPFNVESLKAVISQALFFERRAGRREQNAPRVGM